MALFPESCCWLGRCGCVRAYACISALKGLRFENNRVDIAGKMAKKQINLNALRVGRGAGGLSGRATEAKTTGAQLRLSSLWEIVVAAL